MTLLQQEPLPSHYHFIITRDDRLSSWKMWMVLPILYRLCVTVLLKICDHPVTILYMVYDHPELGMIDYHPGNADGLSQPACCV